MIVWIFAAVAAVAMLTDWWAVHTDRRSVETVAKPGVMIALLGVVATADFDPSSLRWWMIGALLFGLAGDVLLLPRIDNFIGGLAAFLVGHSLYVVAFVGMIDAGLWLIVGIVALAALIIAFGRPIVRGLQGSALQAPVVAYIAITGAVIVSGSATGRWLIVVGALAFAASDGLLGVNRFVRPAPQLRPLVHGLYHTGQAAMLAGVIADS